MHKQTKVENVKLRTSWACKTSIFHVALGVFAATLKQLSVTCGSVGHD